jgi:hypothetical protein
MKSASGCRPPAKFCARINAILGAPFINKIRPLARVGALLIAVAVPVFLVLRYGVDNDPVATVEKLHYTVPMFFIVPLLLFVRLEKSEPLRAERLLLDAAVILLAASRMWIAVIPFSGHMLLLTYAGLTGRKIWFRIIAALLILHATYIKFFVWGDFLTWSVGLAGGLIAAWLYAKVGSSDG